MAIADRDGLEAVSMRRVARDLGVEAMSLYNHVSSKDDLLDGMVDAVIAEIELPDATDWRGSMRQRARSAREVLLDHPWAVGLLDSRTAPGTATLRHHDWVIGKLRKSGFSLPMTAHAFALLDSFIYGFVLQELSLPSDPNESLPDVAQIVLDSMPADQYPHLVELTEGHVLRQGYDFADSFEFGLDLLLDGLEKYRSATD